MLKLQAITYWSRLDDLARVLPEQPLPYNKANTINFAMDFWRQRSRLDSCSTAGPGDRLDQVAHWQQENGSITGSRRTLRRQHTASECRVMTACNMPPLLWHYFTATK